MGITIHYCGTIADLDRVEEFEDRVLDMSLEIGGSARVWRSAADDDPARVVRGLLLDLSPGQETTSLLISPEGWLVPLCSIEAAEQGALAEPPWCFVKTQFGALEGHVALVELLAFLNEEFFSGLQVSDETGYWESRDLHALVDKFAQMQALIDGMGKGLRQTGLSAEAAEDPHILATRIERIARQVHQALCRPPEHAPVELDDDGPDWDDMPEAQWDAMYKEQRRKQERLHRAIEEQLQQGVDHSTAFDNAMRSEGIIDLPGESDKEGFADDWDTWDEEPEDEPWRESLPAAVIDDEFAEEPPEDFGTERHPLQRAASDLWLRAHRLLQDARGPAPLNVGAFMQGLGDLNGGLAQALSEPREDLGGLGRGLALVQLKRAWRGAAFARGSLVPLCAAGLISESELEAFEGGLAALANGIVEELARIRRERESE